MSKKAGLILTERYPLEFVIGLSGVSLLILGMLRVHHSWPILFAVGLVLIIAKSMLAKAKLYRLYGKHEKLNQKHEELRQFQNVSFNEAPIGIAHLSKNWYWLKCNDTFTELLGYHENQFLNMTYLDICSPADRESMQKEFSLLETRKKRSIDLEKRFKHKDGRELWFRIVAAPIICDAELKHYLVIFQDVNDRVQFKNKIELTKNMAIKANRAKDEFLSIMSHELRTPLNSILGFSSLLTDDENSEIDEMTHNYISRIHSNGKHLLELINNILELAKIGTGHVEVQEESFCLEKLLEDTIELLKPIARPKNLELKTQFEAHSIILETDQAKLKQILINLINNAIKFTDKGHILLRCSSSNEGGILIDVEDTGIGIDLKDSTDIFDSFNQVDSSGSRAYNGAGLGLSICKALTELIGGKIHLRSQLNQGSTFSIEIPGHKATIIHQTEEVRDHQDVYDETHLVKEQECLSCLVIDDDEDCCCLYENYFERIGIKCLIALKGSQGIEMAQQHSPDIILCDINMPEISGSEILKALRANSLFAGTPIIAQTAHALKDDREKYLNQGFDGYLSKPVSIDKLKELIHHHFTLSVCE